jgi:hypothetical protein
LYQNGVESSWALNSPCSHQLGPYGWVSDLLLSGYCCRRKEDGTMYVYRAVSEPGENDWNWS